MLFFLSHYFNCTCSGVVRSNPSSHKCTLDEIGWDVLLLLFQLFALLYGWCGRRSDLTLVNSSWTEGHVASLWHSGDPAAVHRVYPPCDTGELETVRRDGDNGADESGGYVVVD